MTKKRWILILIFFFLCSVVVSATPKTKTLSGKITFFHHRTDYIESIFPAYIKDFNQKYPKVEVTLDTAQDYENIMRIKLSSNDIPDIWDPGLGIYTMEQFAQANAVLNKLDIFGDFKFTEGFTDKKGNVYALPQGGTIQGIVIYNKRIFKKLNLKIPTTLHEFITIAKKITATGKIALATAAKAQWTMYEYWNVLPFLLSGDKTVRNKMVNSNAPFTIDSATGRAFAILQQFHEAGILEQDPLSYDWEPMKKDFRMGNIAMFLTDTWFFPQATGEVLKEQDLGMFPFPCDNTDKPRYNVFSVDRGLSLAKNSQYPEAATAFLKFLLTDRYADYCRASGLISCRKSIKVGYPFMKEFEAYHTKDLWNEPDSPELTARLNKAQIDLNIAAQELLTGRSIDDIFKGLNVRWAKAK